MYKVNDYVVYKRDVCLIKEVKNIYNQDYLVLNSTTDKSLNITVNIEKNINTLRNIISKDELKKLIKKIPDIELLDIDSKKLENEYKLLLQDNTLESLIKIIKTTYLRNQIRIDNHKRLTDADQYYFELAEKYLYNEVSYCLNIPFEEAKKYILKELSK